VLDAGKRAGVSNKWSQHATENLAREFPDEYHVLRQELCRGRTSHESAASRHVAHRVRRQDKKPTTTRRSRAPGSASQDPKSMADTGTPSAVAFPARRCDSDRRRSGRRWIRGSAREQPPAERCGVPEPGSGSDPGQGAGRSASRVAKQALSQQNPTVTPRARREGALRSTLRTSTPPRTTRTPTSRRSSSTPPSSCSTVVQAPEREAERERVVRVRLVYEKTNRPDQAVAAYKQAVQIDPNLVGAQINLGATSSRNKQYSDAQATFEKLTGAPFNRKIGHADVARLGVPAATPATTPSARATARLREQGRRRVQSARSRRRPVRAGLLQSRTALSRLRTGRRHHRQAAADRGAEAFLNNYKNAPA